MSDKPTPEEVLEDDDMLDDLLRAIVRNPDQLRRVEVKFRTPKSPPPADPEAA